ncbi:MAG: FAD-dependent oxidoreductase, partial [Coriobacteriales bacterium]|nr:FAD-dependent oxidoreductase [Coriobacteriales bacterium]
MNVSRRAFVKTAASTTALAALAAAPALADEAPAPEAAESDTLLPNAENLAFHKSVPCEPAFVAEPIPDASIVENIDVDVVVCGAGMAGACAAASCAQNGLSVVVLERGEVCASRGSEVGAINDRAHEAAGVYIDPEEFVNDAMFTSHYRADRKIWKKYATRSGEAMNWAIDTSEATPQSECGAFSVSGRNTVFSGVTTWCSGVRVQGGTRSFVEMMLNNAINNGAEVLYETPACQLVREDGGRVCGVIAKTEAGYVKYNAAKGVVLATGGYDNNWDYLSQSIRPRDLAAYAWVNPTKTEAGDGHLMGKAIGAAEDDLPHVLMIDPGGDVNGNRGGTLLAFPRVNLNGERFVNESISLEFVANAAMYQPGARDYVLLAGDLLASFDIMKGPVPLICSSPCQVTSLPSPKFARFGAFGQFICVTFMKCLPKRGLRFWLNQN